MSQGFEPVRLGIAGTGFIAAVHAACARRSPYVELVAVASARGRASRERFEGLDPAVQLLTLDELFASDEVEAIMVCTRTIDHAAHAVEVLKGSKHLLLEKPGAVTVSGQSLLTSAAAEHPELVSRVAYHRRHDGLFREVADRLAGGEIGEPYAIHLTSREDYPPSDADAAAGGFIMDVGVHDFDTARWLLGRDPTAVFTQVHAPVYGDEDVDNAYITIALGDAAATVNLSRTSAFGMDIRCEVVGPGGSIRIADPAIGGGLSVLTGAAASAFPADCRDRFRDAYQSQLDAFARACRGEETAGATLEDDRWAVATAVAARASGVRGERLEVGPSWDWNPAGAA
jgi:predicted dehydrogenase